jgi:hypothetical protein
MCKSVMSSAGRRGQQNTSCGYTSQSAQCHGGGAPGTHEHGSSSGEFDIHPVAAGSNLVIHNRKTRNSMFTQLMSSQSAPIKLILMLPLTSH